MTTEAQMRLERIERLLKELSYEITRGVMEREIEPHLQYTQLMPLVGYTGGFDAALLTVILRPENSSPAWSLPPSRPRLRVVDGG